MVINADWHGKNKMPVNAGFEERVTWHTEHQKYCRCHPTPKKLLEEMKRKGLVRDNN